MSLTLKDMADHVCSVTGLADATSVALAKQFLRRRYQMVYDAQLWDDAKVVVALGVSRPEVILPNWVDRVLAVKTAGIGGCELMPEAIESQWKISPEDFDAMGDALKFSEMPPVGTHTHPDGLALRLVSTNPGDTTQVRIRGMESGLEVEETVTLTGTSPVTSRFVYAEVTHLSKSASTGDVVVSTTAGDEVQILLARETERRHPRLRLVRDFADDSLLLHVLVKRTCLPLVHDNDTPALSGVDNLLVAYAIADMWERLRQTAKAQVKTQEAAALMSSLIQREITQKARGTFLVPEVAQYA